MTKQDFLDLMGSRVEMGEIIVSTLNGDVIVARLYGDDDIVLTPEGERMAAQLESDAGVTDAPRRKKKAPAPDVADAVMVTPEG